MIQLRSQDGAVARVTADHAVEYVDSDGRLSVVVVQLRSGSVEILTPGDPVFNAYCRTHKLTPSTVTVHEPFQGATPRLS